MHTHAHTHIHTGSKRKKKLPAGAVPIFGSVGSGSGLFDDDVGGDSVDKDDKAGRGKVESGLFGDSDDDWVTGSIKSTGTKSSGLCPD